MVKHEEEEWNIRMKWRGRITRGKGGLHWALKFEQRFEGSEKLAPEGKYFSLREQLLQWPWDVSILALSINFYSQDFWLILQGRSIQKEGMLLCRIWMEKSKGMGGARKGHWALNPTRQALLSHWHLCHYGINGADLAMWVITVVHSIPS